MRSSSPTLPHHMCGPHHVHAPGILKSCEPALSEPSMGTPTDATRGLPQRTPQPPLLDCPSQAWGTCFGPCVSALAEPRPANTFPLTWIPSLTQASSNRRLPLGPWPLSPAEPSRFPGGRGSGLQTKATDSELRAVFHGFCQPRCSSSSFPEKLWLEPDANRPMFCCLALHSIQTSKAGASLGPSDLLWEGGQSPAKCYLFNYRGCVRPGLQPKE